MLKAKPMTPTSWILFENSERCGILIQKENQYIIVGGKYAGKYNKIDEIGEISFEEKQEVEEQEHQYIDNFPVKHKIIYDINKKGEYPTYTKRKSSDDVYAAGYFILKNEIDWVIKYCPRIKVLQQYEFRGPFKTKIEATHTIKVENKNVND